MPPSESIRLLPFAQTEPSRRIAMVWRRSSAMDGFLHKLAEIIGTLPEHLFHLPGGKRPPPPTGRKRASKRSH